MLPLKLPSREPPHLRTRRLLTGPDAFATTLLCFALDRFGDEFFRWHPETLRREVEAEAGVRLPRRNFDRLMAAVAVRASDYFFVDAARFVALANVLAGGEFDPFVFDPADSLECAWAITESALINPEGREQGFSGEVRAYVAAVLNEEGYVTAPDVLGIAAGFGFSPDFGAAPGDDPVLTAAFAQARVTKSAEVEDAVLTGLEGLRDQLAVLPLNRGDARDVVARLDRLLAGRGRPATHEEL